METRKTNSLCRNIRGLQANVYQLDIRETSEIESAFGKAFKLNLGAYVIKRMSSTTCGILSKNPFQVYCASRFAAGDGYE